MSKQTLAYLGWQGRGNFGDDLIYEAWKGALPNYELITAPLYKSDLKGKILQALRLRFSRQVVGILVGGGTVIGFANWARHIRRAQLLYGHRSVLLVGAGAAAYDDKKASQLQSLDWDAWKSIPGLKIAGVRGPLSQDALEREGLTSEIVGDPALLFSRRTPLPSSELLGISVGNGHGSAFDIAVLARAATDWALASPGRSIAIFTLALEDEPVVTAFDALVPASVRRRVITYAGQDVLTVLDEIALCTVFISERLHGAIAAASMEVPAISLSYLSKCDDFMRSIGRGAFVVKDDITSDELALLVERAQTGRDESLAETRAWRQRLVTHLDPLPITERR
jgi:polysaccharide pyruvyl transferase WcaK-like protein